jgi:hypothetical protein
VQVLWYLLACLEPVASLNPHIFLLSEILLHRSLLPCENHELCADPAKEGQTCPIQIRHRRSRAVKQKFKLMINLPLCLTKYHSIKTYGSSALDGGKSRDSSVGIALGYGLDDRGPRVRFPEGVGNFSPRHCVQNGSGAHPASYPVGTRGSFPGGKVAGA